MISILIPSVGRPEQLARCLTALWPTLEHFDTEVICSLSRQDCASLSLLAGAPVRVTAEHEGLTGAVLAWNEAYHVANGDVLAMIGDDVMVQDGWLDYSFDALESLGDGIVGLNDMARTDGARFATHFITTRAYCNEHNGGELLAPVYVHYYPDVEACEKANKAGRYRFCSQARIEHAHYRARSTDDAVYAWAKEHFASDERVYHSRKRLGFPVTWA